MSKDYNRGPYSDLFNTPFLITEEMKRRWLDIPIMDTTTRWNRAKQREEPMRRRSDIEDDGIIDALRYATGPLPIHPDANGILRWNKPNPLYLGYDPARGPGRSVAFEHDAAGNRYVFLKDLVQFIDLPITIHQGTPMQDQTHTKQFVTHDVPGFEDGHPLTLVDDSPSIGYSRVTKFLAHRKTEDGIEVTANFALTPDHVQAHVRVKPVKPPKADKKAPTDDPVGV